MSWWTIKYVNTGKIYTSDMIPFRLLPDLQDVSMDCGHRFRKNDLSCTVAERVRIDLYSGAIWVDNKLVAAVPNVNRMILHKRKFEPSHGALAYHHIHAGLVDSEGTGYLVRISETNEIYVERCVVSVKFDGQVV